MGACAKVEVTQLSDKSDNLRSNIGVENADVEFAETRKAHEDKALRS